MECREVTQVAADLKCFLFKLIGHHKSPGKDDFGPSKLYCDPLYLSKHQAMLKFPKKIDMVLICVKRHTICCCPRQVVSHHPHQSPCVKISPGPFYLSYTASFPPYLGDYSPQLLVTILPTRSSTILPRACATATVLWTEITRQATFVVITGEQALPSPGCSCCHEEG